MNRWRPEGWVNPYKEEVSTRHAGYWPADEYMNRQMQEQGYHRVREEGILIYWAKLPLEQKAFELGADAMLEALRELQEIIAAHGVAKFIPGDKEATENKI